MQGTEAAMIKVTVSSRFFIGSKKKNILALLLLAISALCFPILVPAAPPNVNITNHAAWQNEPMVAVNPQDHDRLVVGYNDNRTGNVAVGWSWSDNGGAVWTHGGTIALAGYTRSADPVVAFDSAGTAYLAGLAFNPDNTPGSLGRDGSIFLAKSNDGGHTFTVFQNIVAAGQGTANHLDKPWLFVNPANNHVYLAWTQRANAWGVGGAESMTIWFTRSIDGGVTFSPPLQVSTFNPPTGASRSFGPQIAIGANDRIYVAWHTLENGNPGDANWVAPRLWIAESIDGGVSFGANQQVASQLFGKPNKFISMGADPASGRIYIAYADRPAWPGDYDIYVASAAAAAGPWAVTRISDDPVGSGRAQFWPSLDVAPNGRVDVIWYDNRDDAVTNKLSVYYTASIDGGMTWAVNTRITDVVPGFTPTQDFAGDYHSVASVNDKAYAVWMDNRLGNQEIFGTNISQEAVDAMLVLDISGSMLSPGCPNCAPKLDALKDAVEIFVQLWNSLAVAEPQHRLGVTYFRTNVNEFNIGGEALLPIGPGNNNAQAIIADVDSQTTVPMNLTAMGGGLQSAINRLTGMSPRRIILFTDGMQNVNPMALPQGAALKIDTDPATSNTSNISPTTPPTVLDQQLGRRINTIGVGATPQFVTLLQSIANNTGGRSYTTMAPDANLRRFFVEQLVDALRGASPQLIDYRVHNLTADRVFEVFSVDRSAKKIIFKLSWKRGEPPLAIEQIEKDGVNLIAHARLTSGDFYRIYAFDLPLAVQNARIGPEGDWRLQIYGIKGARYEVAALADEKRLDYAFEIHKGLSKVGEPLRLTARLAVDGRPLSDANLVAAQVFKPGTSVGTALSITPTPAWISAAAPVAAGHQSEPGTSPAQQKLQTLLQQEGFWKRVQPADGALVLASQGNGIYTAIYDDTSIPGAYTVVFRVSGTDEDIGAYTRTETRVATVQFGKANLDASDMRVVSKDVMGYATLIKIQLRPRDARGNYLGPDYGQRIKVSTATGNIEPGFRDLLDGRYEYALTVPTGSDPEIRVAVMDEPLYAGPLSRVSEGASYRFALSAHLGWGVPLGNFNNQYDAGMLGELDFEYRPSPRYSLNAVLGRYRFDPDFDITGGTLYLRGYQPLTPQMEGYVEAGLGAYRPESLSRRGGISLGAGVSHALAPRLRGELGADYFHLFGGGDIDFIGVKAGLRWLF